MIPREFIALYAAANAIAFAMLALAWFRPPAARWACVALFAWASVTNTVTALSNPDAYVGYAALALSDTYRSFISGWFAQHVRLMVLPIAAGQLAIAVLLMCGRPLRRLGEIGAMVFLLAIVPLGVGAGLPFSFTVIAALVFMERGLSGAGREREGRGPEPDGRLRRAAHAS